jgi:hypothetical protein
VYLSWLQAGFSHHTRQPNWWSVHQRRLATSCPPFRLATRPVYMDDNPRPHRSRAVTEAVFLCLQALIRPSVTWSKNRLSSYQWILRHVLKFQPRRAKHHVKQPQASSFKSGNRQPPKRSRDFCSLASHGPGFESHRAYLGHVMPSYSCSGTRQQFIGIVMSVLTLHWL